MTVGERAALLDRDPPVMTVALILGTHVVREMVDDLAVTDEQQVVIGRQCARNLVEEGPHVFVAMTFAGGMLFGGRSPGGTVVPRHGGDDAVTHANFLAPTQHRGRVGGNPDAGGVGTGLRISPSSDDGQSVTPGGKSRPCLQEPSPSSIQEHVISETLRFYPACYITGESLKGRSVRRPGEVVVIITSSLM